MRTSDMGTGSTSSAPSASTRDSQFGELHIEDQGFPAKSGHLDWRASLNFDSLEATVRIDPGLHRVPDARRKF